MSSPLFNRAAWRRTRRTSKYLNDTAWNSAWAIRLVRAACSGRSGPSRFWSIFAWNWTILRRTLLLLNYVNPMAANCWAIDAGKRSSARRPLP